MALDSSPGSPDADDDHDGLDGLDGKKRQPGVKRACNECRQQKVSHLSVWRSIVTASPFSSVSLSWAPRAALRRVSWCRGRGHSADTV